MEAFRCGRFTRLRIKRYVSPWVWSVGTNAVWMTCEFKEWKNK